MYDYVDCVVTEEKRESEEGEGGARSKKGRKLPAGQRDRRKGCVPFYKNNNHDVIPYMSFSFQSLFFCFLLADQRTNMKHNLSVSPDCVYSFFTYIHTTHTPDTPDRQTEKERKRKKEVECLCSFDFKGRNTPDVFP